MKPIIWEDEGSKDDINIALKISIGKNRPKTTSFVPSFVKYAFYMKPISVKLITRKNEMR